MASLAAVSNRMSVSNRRTLRRGDRYLAFPPLKRPVGRLRPEDQLQVVHPHLQREGHPRARALDAS